MDPNDESIPLLMMIENLLGKINEKDLIIKKLNKMVLDLAHLNDLQRRKIEEMEVENA